MEFKRCTVKSGGNEFHILSPEKFHGLSLFLCSVVGSFIGNHPEASWEHTRPAGWYSACLRAPFSGAIPSAQEHHPLSLCVIVPRGRRAV